MKDGEFLRPARAAHSAHPRLMDEPRAERASLAWRSRGENRRSARFVLPRIRRLPVAGRVEAHRSERILGSTPRTGVVQSEWSETYASSGQRRLLGSGGVEMPYYLVNRNAQSGSGDHELHDRSSTKGCLPSPANQLDLGLHASCRDAVVAAKRYYSDVNGCAYCSPGCHTT